MKKWYKITYNDGTQKTIGEVKGSILHMKRFGSRHMWNRNIESKEGSSEKFGWGISKQILDDPELSGIMIFDQETDQLYALERSTWEPLVALEMYLDHIDHPQYGNQFIFSLTDFDITSYKLEIPEERSRMRHITTDQALFLLQTNHDVYRQRQTLIQWKDVQKETVSVFASHDHFVKEDLA